MDDENTNVIRSIIKLLTTPMAKRKGVSISADDCKVWAEELQNYLDIQEWCEAIDEYMKDNNY